MEAGAPTPPEQPSSTIEGLRAWIAQLDRKLGIRTYAGAAAVVLALAAGIVGVVLATSAKDESATKEEVQTLRAEFEAGQQEAVTSAEDEINSLSERVEALEARVNAISSDQRTAETELTVVQDDIADLRTQISDLRSAGAGGTGSQAGP